MMLPNSLSYRNDEHVSRVDSGEDWHVYKLTHKLSSVNDVSTTLGYVLAVLRGLKLIQIPGETSKYISITTVNNYTVSQSAGGHQ